MTSKGTWGLLPGFLSLQSTQCVLVFEVYFSGPEMPGPSGLHSVPQLPLKNIVQGPEILGHLPLFNPQHPIGFTEPAVSNP